MRLIHYRSNISMETIFMSTKNSKMNEPHTFFLNLLQRLNFKCLNKHVALQKFPNYYT